MDKFKGIDSMRIGLDGIPLLTPKTDVGRYTFELATTLGQLSENIDLVFFYGKHWGKRLKATTGANIGGNYQTLRSALSRLVPSASKKWIRQKILEVGLIRYKPELFHATNYVAPSFECPIVTTVHDLSHLRYPETHPAERLAWLCEGLQRAEGFTWEACAEKTVSVYKNVLTGNG